MTDSPANTPGPAGPANTPGPAANTPATDSRAPVDPATLPPPAVVHERRRRKSSRARRRSRRRRIIATSLGALVIVGGFLALVYRDATAIRADLARGRAILIAARKAVDRVDIRALDLALQQAKVPIDRARLRARSIPMRLFGVIPIAGRSAHAAAGMTDALSLALEAGTEATHAMRAFPLQDGRLHYGLVNGRLDLAPWVAARPGLERAAALVERARARFDRVPDTWTLSQLSDARTSLGTNLAELQRATSNAAQTARLIPSLFGGDGHRRYLLVLQNLSELRGTGGIITGFVLIDADQGKLTLERIAPNSALLEADHDVAMPAWYRARYDRFASRRLWSNANMEPDFPVTGTLMARLFHKTVGGTLDGVIATDPLGLRAILHATGPIKGPRGLLVSEKTIAPLILSKEYALFPGLRQSGEREALFVDLASRIWEKLVRVNDVRTVGAGFSDATRGRHLMLWSAHANDEASLARLGLDGSFRAPVARVSGEQGTADAPALFAGVVTQNGSANKMDYYLRRAQELSITPKADGSATFDLKLTLRNTGPAAGLPLYVLGPITTLPHYSPGLTRSIVSFYLPPDSQIESLTVNGAHAGVSTEVAPGALITTNYVPIPPGAAAHLELRWRQPRALAGAGRARLLDFSLLRQPTATPDIVSLEVTLPPGFRGTLLSPGPALRDGTILWQPAGDQPERLRLMISRPLWGRVSDFFSRLTRK